METKKDSQLLMPLILLSVLFSQTWALTALEVETLSFRNVRHPDGVSTSDISSLLDHHSPKTYPASLIEKRASNDISEDQGPIKRGSDAELTLAYSRLIKVKVGNKIVNKLLKGKSKKKKYKSHKDDSKKLRTKFSDSQRKMFE